jgi:hypothetical protein
VQSLQSSAEADAGIRANPRIQKIHKTLEPDQAFRRKRATVGSAGKRISSKCIGCIGSKRIGSKRIGSKRIGSKRIGSKRIGSKRIGCMSLNLLIRPAGHLRDYTR